MSRTVAILAGGLGTRLRPLTARMPKSLVPIAGKPFIDYQLRLLADQGIKRVVICAGYLGLDLVGHVMTGNQFGLDITSRSTARSRSEPRVRSAKRCRNSGQISGYCTATPIRSTDWSHSGLDSLL